MFAPPLVAAKAGDHHLQPKRRGQGQPDVAAGHASLRVSRTSMPAGRQPWQRDDVHRGARGPPRRRTPRVSRYALPWLGVVGRIRLASGTAGTTDTLDDHGLVDI